MADIDNSPWDGNRATREAETVAEYKKICALDRGEAITALSQRFGLPHHYLSKAPVPNVAGVRAARNALAGGRTGRPMTGTGIPAARAHLDAHWSAIQNARSDRPGGESFAAVAMPSTASEMRQHLSQMHGVDGTEDMSMAEASQAHTRAHSARTPRADHSHMGEEMSSMLTLVDEGTLLSRIPIDQWEYSKQSGTPGRGFWIHGYATVYGQVSHDLGGFRTVIDEHALDEVLARNPDVHFVWDHDTRYPLARTSKGTLKLKSDDYGLWIEAEVGDYSWARDLRLALDRGDIDQASMQIQIAEDDWSFDETEELLRTVTKVSELRDVTVTAQGAFPQTSLAVLALSRSLVEDAIAQGRLPEKARARLVAPDEGEDGTSAVVLRAQRLRRANAAHLDEIAALIERSEKL